MIELSEILAGATKAIEPAYFHLQIDGGDPVYRERVYCYELYHQMRERWPPDSPYYLNGEIDKAAHPILMELGAAGAKPDLLIHQPGYMGGNHAVIEVKTSNAKSGAIRDDLGKLSLFRSKVNYQRAIYLFYGHEADARLVARVKDIAASIKELAPIEIWIHEKAKEPALHVATV